MKMRGLKIIQNQRNLQKILSFHSHLIQEKIIIVNEKKSESSNEFKSDSSDVNKVNISITIKNKKLDNNIINIEKIKDEIGHLNIFTFDSFKKNDIKKLLINVDMPIVEEKLDNIDKKNKIIYLKKNSKKKTYSKNNNK